MIYEREPKRIKLDLEECVLKEIDYCVTLISYNKAISLTQLIEFLQDASESTI